MASFKNVLLNHVAKIKVQGNSMILIRQGKQTAEPPCQWNVDMGLLGSI
jgi:hypothetical protein